MTKKNYLLAILILSITVGFSQSHDDINGLWKVKIEKLNYYTTKRGKKVSYTLISPAYSQIYIKDSLIFFRYTPEYYEEWEKILDKMEEKKYRKLNYKKGKREYDYSDNWSSKPSRLFIKNNHIYCTTQDSINTYSLLIGTFKKGKFYQNTKGWVGTKKGDSFKKEATFRYKWTYIKVSEKDYDITTKKFLKEILYNP